MKRCRVVTYLLLFCMGVLTSCREMEVVTDSDFYDQSCIRVIYPVTGLGDRSYVDCIYRGICLCEEYLPAFAVENYCPNTMEEAEAFTGLADHTSYDNVAAMAKAMKGDEYTNFDLVTNALKVDVSGCFFASEQEKIDNAEKGILEAIGKLEKVPEQHGDKKQPSVPALEEITEPATEAPTDAPAAVTEADAGTETGTASAGCKGLLAFPVALMLCAAALLVRRKED